MRTWHPVAVALLLAAGTTTAVRAQQQAPTFEQAIFATWKAEHDKILVMAKDFPADKFGAKPHPDSRTFLDEVRHVTIGLEMSTAQLEGRPFDYSARLAADEKKPATRESIVSEMEAAIKASYAAVQAKASPRLAFWLAHQGEHYGKMVTIYRMNGLVPPVSR